MGFFLEDGNDPYNLRGGILYSDINSDLKQLNFLLDIKDIIMNKEGASDVTLIRFNYFGYAKLRLNTNAESFNVNKKAIKSVFSFDVNKIPFLSSGARLALCFMPFI